MSTCIQYMWQITILIAVTEQKSHYSYTSPVLTLPKEWISAVAAVGHIV